MSFAVIQVVVYQVVADVIVKDNVVMALMNMDVVCILFTEIFLALIISSYVNWVYFLI